jgi:outer membrane autotransporter protein
MSQGFFVSVAVPARWPVVALFEGPPGLTLLLLDEFGTRMPILVFDNELAAPMALPVVQRPAASLALEPGNPPVPLSVLPLESVFPVVGLPVELEAEPLEPMAPLAVLPPALDPLALAPALGVARCAPDDRLREAIDLAAQRVLPLRNTENDSQEAKQRALLWLYRASTIHLSGAPAAWPKRDMQSKLAPKNWQPFHLWLISAASATAACVALAASTLPAEAACDANTTGISVCSGTDAVVAKTATGNLDVRFNNETVTTGGVTISGGVAGFNVDLNVISASGPNPIANTGVGNGVDISSNGGNVAVTTISGATITSTAGFGINSQVLGGGGGNTAITFNADVNGATGGITAQSNGTGAMSVSGSGNVNVTAGGAAAIFLQNTAATTSGDLTINTSGNFNGFINARITQGNNNANISVTHTGTLSAPSGDALIADTSGGGNVSVTTSQLVSSGGVGILTVARGGATTINTGAVTASNAILAQSFPGVTGAGAGSVAITTNGVITSNAGNGINSLVLGVGSGNTAITFNADVNGATGGISAQSNNTGAMSVSGSGNVNVTAAAAAAIFLQNTATTTSGDLTINTSGNFNRFINAQITQGNNNANISVTHTGTLSAPSGDALVADTSGGGNVSVTTSQLVSSGGAGIFTVTHGGATTINTGAVTANNDAIDAQDPNGGTHGIAITTNGLITSTAGIGINSSVTGGSGGIAITNNGAISAPAAVGILGQITGGTGTMQVTNLGSVSGVIGVGANGAVANVFDGGTITGTGGTAILFSMPGNTLTLGPGFAITGLVQGGAGDTFQLGGVGTSSFDASLIGPAAQYRTFGVFNKVDASTWTLTGTNALVLPWTVKQGTLNVTGSLANSPFTVQAGTLSVDGTVGPVAVNGGILMGNGTLGALAVNGGIVAPGHSIGTLNVTGPVSFAAGSFYQVETNGAGQSDKILATGAATLSGGTVQALPATGAHGPSTTYTILTANGGRTGTFSSVTSSIPFLIASLSYDPNDVFLTLTRNLTFLQSQARTPNQFAVAAAIDTFPANNSLFLSLAALNGTSAIRQAFDALSGEVHADLQSSLIDDSRYVRQGVLGRLRQAPYEASTGPMAALGFAGPALAYQSALAYAGPNSPKPIYAKAPNAVPVAVPAMTFWATGYGGWGHVNSDGNAASLSRDIGGFLVGVDRKFGENWWAGLAAGYSHSRMNASDRARAADVDSGHIAGYAGASFSAVNLRAGAAYALHNIDTSRAIVFPGFADTARASYHGGTGQVFGELGYGVATGAIAWEPFGGLAWVHLNTSSFAEVGGPAALNGSASNQDVGYSTLGVRAATIYALANGMTFVPRVTVAWEHAFNNVTPALGLSFQSLATPFAISGVPLARDGALVEAGSDLRINRQTTLGLYYNGYLSNRAQDHAVKGKLSVAF